MVQALPAGFLLAALYAVNGLLEGWTPAYELLVGIRSPGAAHHGWSAWSLSIAGWAAVPAAIGGFVGYIFTQQIDRHRSRELQAVLDELRRQALPDRQGR